MENKSPIVQTVKKVLPSVVSITSSKYLNVIERGSNSLEEEFFGHKFFSVRKPKKKKVKIGGGSGFIVEENGIILTNRHVIEDPEAEYVVILQNGEKLKPKILSCDPIDDVAILKIEKNNLPSVELGDSSTLELGEQVIAIGNALGVFQNTISVGVISGLSRAITAQSNFTLESTRLRGLIQTDAAINPGNSGGPLVNVEGKVVGINAVVILGAENIGFALPINNAKKDLEELKKYGRVRQPFLGVRYILITKKLKEKFNLPVDFGALVISEPDISGKEKTAVVMGSPAQKAGIREADIILELGGKRVTEDQPLIEILQEFQIGEELSIKVLRNGKEKILKAVLAEKRF